MPLAFGDSVIVHGSGDGLLDGRMCRVSGANEDHTDALVSFGGEEEKFVSTKFLYNFAQFANADASKIAAIPPEYRIGRSVVCRSDLPFDDAEIITRGVVRIDPARDFLDHARNAAQFSAGSN